MFGTDNRYINQHINDIRSKKKENLTKSGDNLWVLNPLRIIESINWIPYTDVFRILNKRNNRLLAKEILNATQIIGFERFILVNDKDIFRSFYLKELVQPILSVYIDRDYIVGMPYWKRHGKKLEPELVAKSDLVLCNSRGFTRQDSTINRHAYYIGNGCNISLFDVKKKHPLPADMVGLSTKPIIGYVGALLDMRLDINLIHFLASSRPDWNFVLVGPEDEVFSQSNLHALANVHFLGKTDTLAAPPYIQHFDVCINPQIVNDITSENYPLKIDEYLAMGRPVVATETNVMNEVFKKVVNLADTKESFMEQIEVSLAQQGSPWEEARVAVAKSHSWDVVVENVLRIIVDHLDR